MRDDCKLPSGTVKCDCGLCDERDREIEKLRLICLSLRDAVNIANRTKEQKDWEEVARLASQCNTIDLLDVPYVQGLIADIQECRKSEVDRWRGEYDDTVKVIRAQDEALQTLHERLKVRDDGITERDEAAEEAKLDKLQTENEQLRGELKYIRTDWTYRGEMWNKTTAERDDARTLLAKLVRTVHGRQPVSPRYLSWLLEMIEGDE